MIIQWKVQNYIWINLNITLNIRKIIDNNEKVEKNNNNE